MKPIRLALVLPSMAGGGAERVALELMKSLSVQAYELSLGLITCEGPYIDSIPEHVRVFEIGGNTKLSSVHKMAARFDSFWRDAKPDLLLGFQTEVNTSLLLWLLADSKRRKRLIISEHNNVLAKLAQDPNPLRRRAKRMVIGQLYQRACGVVAVSHGIGSMLAKELGVPSDKINVIHNPVDIEEVTRLAYSDPVIEPVLDDRFTVITAGRLVKQKGFDVLLHAFAELHRTRPSRLILLGDGPLKHDLLDLVRELHIEEAVQMPGFLENPWSLFARSDVFVLASYWEGFGNVIIEAMASGVAVIATDCLYGPREILDNGHYGRLIPVGNASALAQALKDLASDSNERTHLEKVGRKRAKMFSSTKVVAHYDRLFRNYIHA